MPLFITPMTKAPITAPDHLADAAGGRGAADEAGGDDVEFEASAGLGVAVFSRAAKISPASAASTPMLTKVQKVSRSVLMPDSCAAFSLPPSA